MSEEDKKVIEEVKEYYGKVLTNTKDLKTSACCNADNVPALHRKILSSMHPEVIEKFYGCGSPLPPELDGCTVLDLGSGSGRDVYLASALVGPKGKVIGVDMTDEQLDVAKRHIDYHTKQFGFEKPNVEFKKGYIEFLDQAGIEENSVDVVISNCVINLSTQKQRVFNQVFRALKEGGEFYFSDVYADRRVPPELQHDPILYGECLSGALYSEDFRRMMSKAGFADFRVLTSTKIKLEDEAIKRKCGHINFYSRTIRAFKISRMEDKCEDFGQKATYKGTVPDHPHAFFLDDHHAFITDVPMAVCGNTGDMVGLTRYAKHFVVTERQEHRGLFDCGPGSSSACSEGSCC